MDKFTNPELLNFLCLLPDEDFDDVVVSGEDGNREEV